MLHKNNILFNLLILFSFFPFIQVIPLGSDNQPNALLVAMAMLFPFGRVMRTKEQKQLWILFFFSLAVLVISPLNFNSFRSLFSYLSLAVIPSATYIGLRLANGLSYKFYKRCIYSWFVVGVVQLFLYPDFLTFLLPRGDSSKTIESGRGIICLAPEPTHYGLMCILFAIIGYLNFRHRKDIKKVYVCILIQLLIFSRSSLAILVVLLGVGTFLFVKILKDRKKRIIFLLAVLALGASIPFLVRWFEAYLMQFRAGILLTKLMNDPSLFLLLDASVNDRFIHLYFPFLGFLRNWMLPHGYDMFGPFMDGIIKSPAYNRLIMDENMGNEIVRIMSGWGAVFFEVGFLGFILCRVLYRLCFRMRIGSNRIVLFIVIMVIFLNAFPFSTSTAGFLIGNMMYLAKMNRHEETASDKYHL